MDFIIPWVDDNDPAWRKEYLKRKNGESLGTEESRFRDWDNLQYWFRGVEKFTPWVNKIHFVTWGHLPKWLNINHPKLNIVNHTDYIPKEYLPTFNSRTIDLNYHRIEELSEEYVLFNDDVFLLDFLKKEDFFKNGKMRDMGVFDIIVGWRDYDHTILSGISVITKYFSKTGTVRQKPFNWFNLKYGFFNNITNLGILPIKRYGHPSFKEFHLAQPARKSTLNLLWDKEFEKMHSACQPEFRDLHSVNHFVQRYYDLASNNFLPIDMRKRGSYFRLKHNSDPKLVADFIRKQKKPMVCLNDYPDLDGELYTRMKDSVNNAFECILPEKSSFEL
ncbi:Stealth CR1 domain-containing protein [Aequorivita capsosiphonis]|uniref:Stealth CR1 domain-containing protein n=1 Tax=Aequorivita capsosiphonis TaxID=487317 RepID=UPI000403E7E7|nr:Stealth CR1 domain-containing protein [Aequorivita capsosiphonis]